MLVKLMKYDLRGIFKQMLPIYIAGFVIGLISRLFDFLVDKYSFLSIPAAFMNVLFVIVLIVIPIFTFIVVVVKYYKSMVKDEAYLTHTLPVKKNNLVLSKLFDGIIVMIISFVVIVAIGLIRTCGYDYVFEFIEQLRIMVLSYYEVKFIIILFVSLFVGLIMSYVIVFTAIALGQLHNNKKLAMSCVYTVALYYVNQIIGVILLVVPILFNKDLLVMLDSDTPPLDILNGYMILSVVVSIILTVVYHLITVKLMSKKLNLE